ncbi:hypothetical protein OH492_14245 [Vibrio chagasii]|nr:hypothetical protein [Vibrio chagasii]
MGSKTAYPKLATSMGNKRKHCTRKLEQKTGVIHRWCYLARRVQSTANADSAPQSHQAIRH